VRVNTRAGVVLAAGLVLTVALAGVGSASATTGTVAATRYTITDLGDLGGDLSVATAVNNAGRVVGYGQTAGGESHAFEWVDGTITDLGTLGGGSSRANAINDDGTIAGTASRLSGGFGYAVRWRAGVIQDLGSSNAFQLSFGNGVDPSGRVVGGQRDSGSRSVFGAIFDQSGSATELRGPAGELGPANGVNARGQIVGAAGYVWRDGTVTSLPGLPGSSGSVAQAINIRGQVVGASFLPATSTSRAVLWQDGVAVDIGTVDAITTSRATAINAAGQVVGTADPGCHPCPSPRAWLWNAGRIAPLDDLVPTGSGWVLREANGINDRGQIVGGGVHNGRWRAFLLTPAFHANINMQPTRAAVPSGYLADTGAVFGSRGGGLTYGWNTDNTANSRKRASALSPDQRYDTLTHTQKPDGATTWEICVPNGRYTVHVVAGDPSNIDSRYRIAVEGVPAVSGVPGDAVPGAAGAGRWLEGTVTVTVTDGRLTVGNAPGAVNNKINYIDIISA
jgi:probable HAF family extracellular repeat protein